MIQLLEWCRKIGARLGKKNDTEDSSVAAAIAAALTMYMEDTVHDYESYKLTIIRK